MLLKRLEINGFKSFANRVAFEYGRGITVLVGPNGSGKSNAADAVRWVLGEQSTRALRGKKPEEVIFVGSAGRHPLGMAEVALVLDNTDRGLAFDYAEVRLARRLYRSGESEYLVNGARVRRKDLVALLLEVGLHSAGYTVIGQGAVEELVIQSPDDRRVILEHAADLTRHQARVAETRSRLDDVERNLTRTRDLIAELEPHARRLRSQAERAQRHAVRRSELAAVARAYFRGAIRERMVAARVAETTLRMAADEYRAIELTISALDDERQQQRWQVAELESAIAHVRETLAWRHQEQAAALGELASKRERAGFLEAKLQSLSAETDRLVALSVQLDRESAGAAPSLTHAGARRADALGPLNRAVDDLNEQLRQARRRLEAAREGQVRLAQERQRLEQEAETERQRLERKRQAEAAAETRRATLEARLEDQIREVARLEQEWKNAEELQQAAKSQLASVQRNRQSAREIARAERDREQAARGELQVVRAAATALEQEARTESRTGEASSSPVLAAGLRVPADLERAVAATLGEWAQAALAIRTDDALSLITLSGGGRRLAITPGSGATPTDRWREAVNRALAGLSYRFAADEIRMAEGHRLAVLGPLGRAIIVKDRNTAVQAVDRLCAEGSGGWIVATLEGEVATDFGGWARGSERTTDHLISLSRRQDELRDRLTGVETRVSEATAERVEAERILADWEVREREAQSALAAAAGEVRLLSRRHHDLIIERRHSEGALRELPPPSKQVVAEAGDRLAQRRAELERSAAAWVEQEAAAATSLHDIQVKWERTWAEREELRREVEREAAERQAFERRVAERRRQTTRVRAELDHVERQAGECSSELRLLREALSVGERRAAELADAVAACGREIDHLTRLRSERIGVLDQLEVSLLEQRKVLATRLEARETALLASQQASDELLRLQQEAAATADEWSLDGEALVQLRLPGTGELHAAGIEIDEAPTDLASARRRLNQLQRELRSLGSISEDMLEEYREVEQRLEFLRSQSKDLWTTVEELRLAIGELEGIMRQSFQTAFDQVNSVFGKTFATLFGGGTARLALTDPRDPLRTGVDIEAQPPGKRLQNLMSLSGGERALTSTALIFALLAINPLPFCVLDEVDAALDEPNARRFAALLQEYSERTQFIVITHNRATMEVAGALYGISMGSDGVTTVLSLRPNEALSGARNGRADHGAEPVLQV